MPRLGAYFDRINLAHDIQQFAFYCLHIFGYFIAVDGKDKEYRITSIVVIVCKLFTIIKFYGHR